MFCFAHRKSSALILWRSIFAATSIKLAKRVNFNLGGTWLQFEILAFACITLVHCMTPSSSLLIKTYIKQSLNKGASIATPSNINATYFGNTRVQ